MNDGCVIARTREAKALGIGMGDLWHEVRGLCEQRRVQVLSSNFALYGDMSARLQEVLEAHAGKTDVYSIDESFLDDLPVTGLAEQMRRLGRTVKRWTGIPVSIGCGTTRTLAKVAVDLAKDEADGVATLHHLSPRDGQRARPARGGGHLGHQRRLWPAPALGGLLHGPPSSPRPPSRGCASSSG